MNDGSIDITSILDAANAKGYSGQRYIVRNKKKIKAIEYNDLPEVEKKDLAAKDGFDFSQIDDDLEQLHMRWEIETNLLTKEILFLKYDLLILSTGSVSHDEIVIINNIKLKLDKLEGSLR